MSGHRTSPMERWLQIGSAVAAGALAVAVLTGVAAYRLGTAAPTVEVAAGGLFGTAGKLVSAEPLEPIESIEPIESLQPSAALTTSRTLDAWTAEELDMPRIQTTDTVHEVARLLSVQPPAAAAAELEEAPVPVTPAPLGSGQRVQATLSFYYCQHLNAGVGGGDGGGFCGYTADGSAVAPGVAACDRAYLGQVFRIQNDPQNRVYRCADTGSAVGGQHRDVWFNTASEGWAWIEAVGHQGVIEILR